MLIQNYVFVKGYPKGSGSRTDIWEVERRIDGKKFVLKLFIDTVDGVQHPASYELLKHEIRTYRLLQDTLILKDNVRNILPIYAIGIMDFNSILDFVWSSPYNNLSKKDITENIITNTKFMLKETSTRTAIDKKPARIQATQTSQNKKLIEKFTYAYVVTPMIEGPEMDHFLTSNLYWTPSKLCRYMAVLMTTLYQMSNLGINQNDLHLSNILLSDTLYGPTDFHSRVYLLVFGRTTFLIDLEYTPLVYDFDRSAIYGRYFTNLETKMDGGNCPQFHPKRDFIRILCGIYQVIKEMYHVRSRSAFRRFQDDILYLIYNRDLRRAIQYANSSCWLERGRTSFQCDDELLNEGMASREHILRFFFGCAEFRSFPTELLLSGDMPVLSGIVHTLINENRWSSDLLPYLEANVQFVVDFSPETQKQIISSLHEATTWLEQ
jgi:hypothetical protein